MQVAHQQQHPQAMVTMQEMKLNRLYQSEDHSQDFALETRNCAQKFLSKSTVEIETSLKSEQQPQASSMVLINSDRRFYSNSKLDYQRWQRALTKKPAYDRIENWSSNFLSEYELRKFLAQSNTTSSRLNHHLCGSHQQVLVGFYLKFHHQHPSLRFFLKIRILERKFGKIAGKCQINNPKQISLEIIKKLFFKIMYSTFFYDSTEFLN